MAKKRSTASMSQRGIAREALLLAVRRMHDGTEDAPVVEKIRPLVEIWYRAIDEAKNGNMQATTTIMDRIDGKPGQSVDLVADIKSRTVEDMSDEELLSIAQHGGAGASTASGSEETPSGFY